MAAWRIIVVAMHLGIVAGISLVFAAGVVILAIVVATRL